MTISGADLSTQIDGLLTQTLDHATLFERLQQGHKLVTANSRLSRILTGEYHQWRISRGDKQWRSPHIKPWNQWIDSLWETAALQGLPGTDRAVPGSRQLLNLWEITLKNEAISKNLLRPEALAGQLRDTRELIVDWQMKFDDPAWKSRGNENTEAFQQWNKAFEKHCQRGGWISPEDRIAILERLIRNGQLASIQPINLLGFDEFNPAQASLLSVLVEQGSAVCLASLPRQNQKAVMLKCMDGDDELQQAARWARYWTEKDPESSIAIVVHDLRAKRRVVERQLGKILTPHEQAAANRTAKPWNISMGEPLASVPLIESAFDLLKLLDRHIDIQDVGRVLRSPWLKGAETERNSRALLEKCLREKYPRQLKLSEVRYRASEIKKYDRQHQLLPEDQHEPQDWQSPVFAAILETLILFEKSSGSMQPPSAWADSVEQLLSGLGWPLADDSESHQDAMEHSRNWQALQSWRDALRELASLDATTPKLGRKSVINQLRKICQEKVFQPHSAPASIQVLGLYEASGLRFDHLWVAGLHNDNWPPTASPNPFIPGTMQKSAHSPHSTPQRELQVARTVTRRLLETSPDTVFSYPCQMDGEAMLPSPLLRADDIEEVDPEAAGDQPPTWSDKDWRAVVAAAEEPTQAPLMMPGALEHDTARGGSSILKHQALCPFRAFASNRLGAEGLETPVDGISPMLHGSLVHRVLEFFWTETRNQENLLQLNDDTLAARVQKHVDDVTESDRSLDQRPAFRDVEAKRIFRHVMDYLALEKDREAFEVIGFEQEVLPEIHSQTIRLIIDRVDRLPSGDEIIIDYKTGKVEPRKWFGERPEEPQLPLYAISAGQAPAAVVYGIIRDDGCLYKGVVKREGLLPDLPPPARKSNQYLIDAGLNMEDTIEDWRQVLHNLMADFLAGQAAIDPKDGRKTCNSSHCDLQSLCRIGELEQIQKDQPGAGT